MDELERPLHTWWQERWRPSWSLAASVAVPLRAGQELPANSSTIR